MATTGSNFVEVTSTVLEGATVTTAPSALALMPGAAETVAQGSGGTVVDKVLVDLALTALPTAGSGVHIRPGGKALGNYAKNGMLLLSTSTTTAVDVDLTDLTLNTPAGYAGDTAFATVNVLVFRVIGTSDMTVKPGGSNPSNAPKFTGTTPTLALPGSSVVVWHSNAGVTIDSTHKVFTITPTAGGVIAISVGGA